MRSIRVAAQYPVQNVPVQVYIFTVLRVKTCVRFQLLIWFFKYVLKLF